MAPKSEFHSLGWDPGCGWVLVVVTKKEVWLSLSVSGAAESWPLSEFLV